MSGSSDLRSRLREGVDQIILDATERVVGRVGIGAMTMQAVAQEAGVAVGTLYNHFGDRERLLGTLVIRHRDELSEAMQSAFQTTRNAEFTVQLRAFVMAAISLFDRRRGFVRAALDSELWRGYADAVDMKSKQKRVRIQLESGALRLVRVGLKAGVLAKQPAERLTAHLSGMLRGTLLMRAKEDQPAPAEEEATALVEAFLNGHAADRASKTAAPARSQRS